jgi:hypothetical protein
VLTLKRGSVKSRAAVFIRQNETDRSAEFLSTRSAIDVTRVKRGKKVFAVPDCFELFSEVSFGLCFSGPLSRKAAG